MNLFKAAKKLIGNIFTTDNLDIRVDEAVPYIPTPKLVRGSDKRKKSAMPCDCTMGDLHRMAGRGTNRKDTR